MKKKTVKRVVKRVVFEQPKISGGVYDCTIKMIDQSGNAVMFPDTLDEKWPVKNWKEFSKILMFIELVKGQKADIEVKAKNNKTIIIANFV